MANIREIAKAAGVSVATVSRVLNGHPYVSAEKRRRVEEAMRRAGYSPNSNAVHLSTGRTGMVGVILPFSHHPYFHALLGGLMEEALKHQYTALLCQTNYEAGEERRYLQMLRTKQVDGLILCSHELPWAEIAAYAADGLLVACEPVRQEGISCVYTHHYEAFLTGMRYLIRRGHRNIGFCIGRRDSESSRQRYAAYADAMQEIGRPVQPEWIFEGCTDLRDGMRVMDRIAAMESRPSALLVTGDEAAAGVLARSRQLGIAIPGELAIVGFDNQPISEALQLTTIDQHLQEIGRQAFGAFYHGIVQPGAAPRRMEVPFELVERTSV
ncbi:LacI family DNA-binding transcriptional regulator [Paenibacillus mucilaginosus]|uniref:LacI n=1 Tax=Paenibacillus mucilaginosus (strain KNP414) TaxID=1036673 RepID=F8FAL3_PAEMK|nr:LacI family DNA-binding transcriptional regulator [Paenibacillus mucilaginosus]AEI41102.1 LacI [Paenibacillus mucilaginosus KNP414]MCG7211461.1 LacI family DNA-binding transcriptional regulator [Paenibacillus mucilaginosus]WDM30163.1 LacI family DNA-binding transcriptional regulator [Paenibacillus mucilaginosus]